MDAERYHLEVLKLPPVECGCGCKGRVTWYHGVPRKFIRGHASFDPTIKALMVKAGKAAAADPVKCKKNSDAVQAKWRDPEYRRRVMEKREAPRLAALRKVWDSPEFAERQRELKVELWNDPSWASVQRSRMQSDEFKQKVSEGTKKALSDPKIRLFLSHHAADMQANGTIGPNRGNPSWVRNPFTDRDELMHSSWEEAFLHRCIEIGHRVTKVHEVRIPYEYFDSSEKTYVPDFVTLDDYDGKPIIYEVKGFWDEDAVLKCSAGKLWAEAVGYEYIVIDTLDSIMKYEFTKRYA